MDNIALDEAFRTTPRAVFLPSEVRSHAFEDRALSIGYGQTNSQPTTVSFMLELLDVHEGDKALDIGSGSGWTTALLSRLVGHQGSVVAVERIPELLEWGQDNCAKLEIANAEFHPAAPTLGWPNGAPYDRILVSAAAHDVPEELLAQLARGGRMVLPIDNAVVLIDKRKSGAILREYYYGFAFVPLVLDGSEPET